MFHSIHRAAAIGACLAAVAGLALAADPPALAASAPVEEVPFWAVGMPKGNKLAPVPSFPIATPAAQLPVAKLKVPPGFKVEVWASDVLDARGLRQGDKGTVFVSSLFVAGKVYAITDKGGKREVKTIAEKLNLPNGIEFYKGALYVATPAEITRYDNIEANLDNPPKPVMVYDKLPGDVPHSWKYIRIGPDGKLYVPIGAPCNICARDDAHMQIRRMNLDGSGVEVVATGVRNTVGFDFDPKNGDLWFTNNGRDWLSEDLPNDSSTTSPRAASSTSAIRIATRATSPIRSSAGARPAAISPSRRFSPARTPARSACASTPARCSRRNTTGRSSSPATARGTGPRSSAATSSSPGPTARAGSARWSRS